MRVALQAPTRRVVIALAGAGAAAAILPGSARAAKPADDVLAKVLAGRKPPAGLLRAVSRSPG